MKPAEALAAAMRHHQAGNLAEAERLYAKVLAAEPRNLQALTLSAALAHMAGRHDQAVTLFARAIAVSDQPDLRFNLGLAHWSLGQRSEAVMHWSRAIALDPNFAPAHMNLGNASREDGRLDEAVAHLRRALQLQPSPFVHNNLGLALSALGDAEASAHYQRAIAMHPGFVEPYLNLALDLARDGKPDDALLLVRRSLQIAETPDNKALFVRLVGALEAIADDGALRALVTRAAAEGWGPTTSLAPAAATLLKHGGVIAPLLQRAERTASQMDGFDRSALATMAAEPLLRWLLESEVVCDLALERLLTAARAAMLALAEAEADALQGSMLHFACALARQCFINEYVYPTREDETARVARLREAVVSALRDRAPVAAGRIAVVAAYVPLRTIEVDDALLALAQDAPLATLVDQQISAPRREEHCRAAIPRLTAIDDAVSRLVQDQYEQNPYPRWIVAPQPRAYDSADALMRSELPLAPFRPLAKGTRDILIAGCGTGRQAIGAARQWPGARVLAIDLSSASLGYAKARSEVLATTIDYAQADILQLESIGRSFDLIQCDGVLHHLADPWAGWRVLLSILRPGGLMHVSLYSEIARRDVVAARAFIATRGYAATADGIRACRSALMAQPDGTPLKNIALFNDFFSTSECRDLLFHVQEHRMTLPAIRDFLGASGLQFLGFDLDFRVMREFAARFPADRAMTDLDHWDAFEQDHPYTFASMYRFWIQKPA